MKHHALALALFAVAGTGTACVDAEDGDALATDEVSQDLTSLDGCDVTVDLTNSTGEAGGIHGARSRMYSCENINFYITTGGHDWTATTTWDGEYDLSGCDKNWLRTRDERLSPTYWDSGTTTTVAQEVQYWGYLNGVPFLLTKCGHPVNVRELGAGKRYKLSVKAFGGAAIYPHDTRDQNFDFEFVRH